MNMRSRITRGLGAVLMLGGALLTAAPGATAATTSGTAVQAALAPPTLTGAEYFPDNQVNLSWEPSATVGDTVTYDILADGKQVAQTAAHVNGGNLLGYVVLLDRTGATSDAEYTIVAEDAAGNKSAPSNGLVPVNQQPLPKPVLKSAVVSGDKITFSWEPTVTDAASVTYHVIFEGTYGWGSVRNQTTFTTDRTKSFDTGPTGDVVVTINPGTGVVVYAEDSNGDRSPWSNEVSVTEA